MEALGQQGQGLSRPPVQGQTAGLFQRIQVFEALDQAAQQGPDQQTQEAKLPWMLGELLLRHEEEVADGGRHGRQDRQQVGENEGERLNGYAGESWEGGWQEILLVDLP